ncbi:hypothetical protein PENSPDRAFT_686320 [Peniophora sp. CONT]|nr:hypothetical protein PENSPDRAFT_686320 [Peniophora sp. CONT]
MSLHDLPTELLLYIFKLIADHPADGSDSVIAGTSLSRVCRLWRELALSLQELWAALPRTDSAFTNLCLERCLSAPLYLNLKSLFLGTEDKRQAVQCLYPHFGRVKRISLIVHESRLYRYETYPIGLRELKNALRAQPLCALEHLELKLVTYPGEAYGPPMPMPSELSQTLFPATLHDLTCSNIIFARDQHVAFSNIRRLDLVQVQAWHCLDDISAFFRSMPLLEYFSHTRFILNFSTNPTLVPNALPASRSVQMRYLRTFRMEGLLPHAYAVFSCLEIPSSATLIIQDTDPGIDTAILIMLYRHIPDQYLELLKSISSALYTHFAIAIARDIHYDSVRLDRHIVTALDVAGDSFDGTSWAHTNVLPAPGNIRLHLPPVQFLDDLEFESAALEAACKFILPIFSTASIVELGKLVEPCQASMFTAARIIQLESVKAMSAFARGPLRTALECVRVMGVALHEETDAEECRKVVRYLREGGREVRLELVKCDVSPQALESLRGDMQPWKVVCDE